MFDPIIVEDASEYLNSGGLSFSNTAIIGASGLLGSYLLDFISAVNAISGVKTSVLGFSRSTTPQLEGLKLRPGVFTHSMDAIEAELSCLGDVHVIHAASPASVSKITPSGQSLLESNVHLTERLFRVLDKMEGRLTYLSTGEVYGNQPNTPTLETDYSGFDHLDLRGFYPEVKRFSELLCRSWSNHSRIPVTVLRVFHTFGPGLRSDDTRIFADTIFSFVRGDNISLRSDGAARRSFMYSSDLASAVRLSSDSLGFEVFNVCGEPELSMVEFANLVAQNRGGCRVLTETGPHHSPMLESTIPRGQANTDRLRSLGWTPRTPVEEAVRKTISSVRWRQSQGWL